jgi:hypothetical protein
VVSLKSFVTMVERVLAVGVEDGGMAKTPYRIELSESEARELRRRARQQTRAYREVLL